MDRKRRTTNALGRTRCQRVIDTLRAHSGGLTMRELADIVDSTPKSVKQAMWPHKSLFESDSKSDEVGRRTSKIWRLRKGEAHD